MRPEELTPAERIAVRLEALMLECLRVDELGEAAGHDRDQPGRDEIEKTLRSARNWQTHWRTRREMPVALWRLASRRVLPVATVRRISATPRPATRRRVARTVGSRGDPHLADGEESDEPPVAPLRGFMPASVRMVQHCERRRAKKAAA
jgi:hypothetical protein